uniref:MIF4G domain-containing protein n=1 Tax=Anopheles maculatus TaxID=74869 RepID=A0A182S5T7_9DIPT
MDYLTGVIAELFDNPGLFDDSIMTKLPKKLGDMRQDHYVLSSTIEMIFEQSIRESNFRYMGARLCKLLDSLNNGPNLALRELLQLKMEDQSGELPQFMKNEQVKVRGATLFLAELYMQLRDPQQPFGKTISEHIINAIEILLAKEGPENTKCVCQCLKLCGYELEQDCPEKVESILHKLQSQTNVQSSTEAMIRSVFTLRKNAWGRSEEPAAAIPPMPVPTDPMLMGGVGAAVARNSPVFYGPDGKVLTEEEHSFLSTNVEEGKNPNAYNDYDDDDEYGLVDPNEDLEIQEAYEDFIQSSGQNQQQQQYRPNV